MITGCPSLSSIRDSSAAPAITPETSQPGRHPSSAVRRAEHSPRLSEDARTSTTATPVTTERSVWGGLRSETVSDLELSPGREIELTPWERAVTSVANAVIDGSSERLSQFRGRIEDERVSMSKRFETFKSAVDGEVTTRKWFDSIGALPLVLGLVVFGGIGALLAWRAIDGWRTVYPRWSDVVLLGLAFACFVNSAVLVGARKRRQPWARPTAGPASPPASATRQAPASAPTSG